MLTHTATVHPPERASCLRSFAAEERVERREAAVRALTLTQAGVANNRGTHMATLESRQQASTRGLVQCAGKRSRAATYVREIKEAVRRHGKWLGIFMPVGDWPDFHRSLASKGCSGMCDSNNMIAP